MAFVTDTFTEASDQFLTSHTADSGGTWSNVSRTMTVIGSEDRVRGDSSSATSIATHSATPASNQYDVEAVIRRTTTDTTPLPGVLARYDSGSNSYIQVYMSQSDNQLVLAEVSGGSVSESNSGSQTWNADQNYALKLEVRNGTNGVKAYVDGSLKAQVTGDVATAVGKVGIRSRLYGRVDTLSASDAVVSGEGASDITFATTGVSSAIKNSVGASDITFATSGAGQSLANAAGASDITFATSGVGQSSSSGGGVGASDITFATLGAWASIVSAAGSASLTFTTTGVAEGQAQTATQAAPAGRGKRRRRFILPNNAEIVATQEEVNEILRAFVKTKPTKKKVARIVPLADQIEAKEETRGNEVVERISVKPVALWKPDPALYEEMVRRVVARRQRRELEFLLLAA